MARSSQETEMPMYEIYATTDHNDFVVYPVDEALNESVTDTSSGECFHRTGIVVEADSEAAAIDEAAWEMEAQTTYTVRATCAYIPSEIVHPDDLALCRVVPSLLRGRALAYPSTWVRLSEDWPADRTGGPAGPYQRIPAGSSVRRVDGGDETAAAKWLVRTPS